MCFSCKTTWRKQGWNDAIDEVLRQKTRVFCKSEIVRYVQEWTNAFFNKVKALKEEP